MVPVTMHGQHAHVDGAAVKRLDGNRHVVVVRQQTTRRRRHVAVGDLLKLTQCVGVIVEQRDECFPEGMAFRFLADLRLRKNRGVTGHYFFWAFGTNGVTPVLYEILLTGTPSGATFAPDPDEATTVTWDGDASLGAQGESEESACAPGGAGGHISVPTTGSVRIDGDPVT